MKKRVTPARSVWHIRQPIGRARRLLLNAAGVASVLLLYALLSHRQHLSNPADTTIPDAAQMWAGVKQVFKPVGATEWSLKSLSTCWAAQDFAATFGRLFWGMAFATAVSVVVGIAMGCYRSVEAFFGPVVDGAAKEPATAMLAAFFVLLGTGEWLYTGVIVFGTAPRMVQSVFAAAREVPKTAVYKAITLNASPAEQVWNLVFKWVFPRIIEATRVGVADSLVYLLAAEMMVGDAGFGYRMKIQSRLLNMNVTFTYLAILCVTGYALDFAFRKTQEVVCPWYGEK